MPGTALERVNRAYAQEVIRRRDLAARSPVSGEVLARGGTPARRRSWLDFGSMLESFAVGGNQYVAVVGSGSRNEERIETNFRGLAEGAYKRHGPVFACMAVRMLAFSEARFMYRELRSGRPGDLFSTSELDILRRPWRSATTGDLLTRMIVDADLAGNAFVARRPKRLRRLRPDWVTVVLGAYDDGETVAARLLSGDDLDAEVLGYLYAPDDGVTDPEVLLPDQVAHFAPYPDSVANYRGQSWLTPIIREIVADAAATTHKLKFFERGARLQYVVSLDKDISTDQFDVWVEKFRAFHEGVDNAYRTVILGGGADITAITANMAEVEMKALTGAAEPLALDTPVPTPVGWSTIGDLRPGDQVIGRDGRPAWVVGVSSIHHGRNCFRITLKDRTSIVADGTHLWVAVDRNTSRRLERSYTTYELYELSQAPYRDGVGGYRIALPAAPVIELDPVDLLVDPYVLGAWLGDGQTSGAAICGADEDIKFIAAEVESRGYSVSWWTTGPGKADVFGLPGGLLAALRALDVLGDKHIPMCYLRASVDQRLDLLRGLMDTDGTVDNTGKGSCVYASKDERLARQVAELLRSLGYRATVRWQPEPRSRTGRAWSVGFRVAQDRVPFLLPRKVDRCTQAGDPYYTDMRSIVSIQPVDSVPVRCIAIDTCDHLFLVGDGFVATHNTRIAAAARVHPVVVGFSEGLAGSSLNAGNYKAAVRNFGDLTMRPLWRNAAGSLESIVDVPADAELWYDTRDIAFLRDDETDVAEIQTKDASAIRQLIDGGFKPDAVVDAVASRDLRRLVGQHSGLPPVQVQPAPAGAVPNGKVPAIEASPGGEG